MSQPERYLVAATRPWNRRVFEERIATLPGEWRLIEEPAALTPEILEAWRPRYVFFLHWSWRVPAEIVRDFECVCFHMTDVPYGRGGSPLQNLIVRGARSTKLSALRMTEELDAGPVYLKEELSLEGNAEEIFIRASELAAGMIERIVRERPEPRPQEGETVVFRRRRPEESRIPELDSLGRLHDFIRMMDAEGYPHAFLEHGGFRYEFGRAALYDGRIVADVTIRPLEPAPAAGGESA